MALKALARSASLVFLGLTAVIVAGEPAFSLSQLTGTESAQLAVFAAGCLALVAAWKWPVCGGLAALTLLSLFCLINLTRTGHLPLGWMFALMAIAATLFVASGWASGRRAPRMG
jgi:hypothetical protein